ncbi:hypothetical protein Taro_038175, partial [Colocasia esculenta]|nr:hypothetical protein [Colocasia esculenta]
DLRPPSAFSLLPSSVGPSSFSPSKQRPPHFWRRLWESRRRSPPIDVDTAPAGANNDVPAPVAAVPAIALEMAELWGQMQQLTGICLTLQAQLAGPPAPTVSLPRERHRQSRRIDDLDQQENSPHQSRRAPSEERAPECRGRSPRRSVAAPRPLRSVVAANSHGSAREGSANSEQELARSLRRVVDLERRVDAMVQRAEGKTPAFPRDSPLAVDV